MLQAANTDLFNPLVPNSQCQNLLFPLQIKLVNVSESYSIFCIFSTNWLSVLCLKSSYFNILSNV